MVNVIDGKGGKNRFVGVCPEAEQQIRHWLNRYRPESEYPHLLLQEDGMPLTASVIQGRIRRLRRAAGIYITAHGLRRLFATFNAEKGIPLHYLKSALGHSDISTTQIYLQSDARAAAKWFHNGRNQAANSAQPPAAKLKQSMFSSLFDDL